MLGSGSAKSGVGHWWRQRLTSIALVPLSVWFVVSLLALPSFEHATLLAWIGQSRTALGSDPAGADRRSGDFLAALGCGS